MADRLPGTSVEARHLAQQTDPVTVLETEQAVEVPVQVVAEVGDLTPQVVLVVAA
jgi:hypothetical protein